MSEPAPKPEKASRTPQQRADRELTERGWAFLVLLALSDQWLDMSEPTLAFLGALILLSVNLVRLVKGLRIHFLSSALGLISLFHAWAYQPDQPHPMVWYLAGGAVAAYLVAKLLLRERIR